MGSLNLSYFKSRLEDHLKNDTCPICENKMNPINTNSSLDAFEYVCKHCNPNSIIAISGSLVADELYKSLINDEFVKSYLYNQIHKSTPPFPRINITTLQIENILSLEKDKTPHAI